MSARHDEIHGPVDDLRAALDATWVGEPYGHGNIPLRDALGTVLTLADRMNRAGFGCNSKVGDMVREAFDIPREEKADV